MHFLDDVAASEEFSLDVDLWDGRPVAEIFDLLSQLAVGQHVDVLKLDAVCAEEHDNILGEAALGHLLGSLHEDAYVVFFDLSLDRLDELVFAASFHL